MSTPSTPLTSAAAATSQTAEDSTAFNNSKTTTHPTFSSGSPHSPPASAHHQVVNYGGSEPVAGTLVVPQQQQQQVQYNNNESGGGVVGDSKSVIPVLALDEEPTIVTSPYYLYRGVPSGLDTYTWIPQERQLYWNCKRCCCCGWCPEQPEGDLVQLPGPSNSHLSLLVAREPVSCLRVTRDGFLSFIFAMLFHFVPAVLSGVEQALGSAENHQRWGMVWFGLWPIWWLIASVLLRPWGVRIVQYGSDEGGCCGEKCYQFLPCATYEMANEMAGWLNSLTAAPPTTGIRGGNPQAAGSSTKKQEPPVQRGCLRPGAVIGTSILIFLLAWGLHTMLLIQECNDLGCCKDDGKTLANCTRIWEDR